MNKTFTSYANDEQQTRMAPARPSLEQGAFASLPAAGQPIPSHTAENAEGFNAAPRFSPREPLKAKSHLAPTLNNLRRTLASWYLNPLTLRAHDTLQLFNYPILWHCPRRYIQAQFAEHVGHNHLEVGSATGYFLHRLNRDTEAFRLTLMDLNVACLGRAKRTLIRYQPSIYQKDICQFIPHISESFDSICVNNVLQSTPGAFAYKGRCFQHLRRLLAPGGRVFGHVVVSKGANFSPISVLANKLFNYIGVYNNQQDSVKALREALELHFEHVVIEVRGAVAIFSAH